MLCRAEQQSRRRGDVVLRREVLFLPERARLPLGTDRAAVALADPTAGRVLAVRGIRVW